MDRNFTICFLNEFHLQMEMAADSYVLAIMTIADEEEGWKRLADALLQIDGRIEDVIKDRIRDANDKEETSQTEKSYQPAVKLTISQALECVGKEVPFEQAQGEISGGFINLYPPGIPIVVPGEVIDSCVISRIQESLKIGLRVQGISENAEVVIV